MSDQQPELDIPSWAVVREDWPVRQRSSRRGQARRSSAPYCCVVESGGYLRDGVPYVRQLVLDAVQVDHPHLAEGSALSLLQDAYLASLQAPPFGWWQSRVIRHRPAEWLWDDVLRALHLLADVGLLHRRRWIDRSIAVNYSRRGMISRVLFAHSVEPSMLEQNEEAFEAAVRQVVESSRPSGARMHTDITRGMTASGTQQQPRGYKKGRKQRRRR